MERCSASSWRMESCAAHMEKQDEHVIDVPLMLAQELTTELASLKPLSELAGGDPAPTPIIVDKVGELTRNVDPHQYLPHHVSIGPYNRISNAGLARDAGDKLRTLQEVLAAAAAYSTTPLQLKDFVTELELLEGRARSSYGHSFNVPSKEFLRWLLLDACFILVRFGDVVGRRPRPAAAVANYVVQGENRVVPSVERRASAAHQQEVVDVVRDVFYLAENQIPFFVVDKVYQMTFLDSNTPALDAIARFAGQLLEQKQYSVATPTMVGQPEPANLLHLLHMHFAPTVLTSAAVGGGGTPVGRWRTAMDYYFVGVNFKKRPLNRRSKGGGGGGALSILDVKVSGRGGTLEVPQLNIDGETWRLFRNLIALEQSNPSAAGSHVTAYCVFMSQLASTARDVELLLRRGVIVHGLGNHGEEVPQLNIDAETWRLLRNLIALEQSNPSAAGSHVTAYCVFMSQLASTPMDVELLSRRGVIVHGLGNNGEVAKHLADLCKGAVFNVDDADQNYLRPVCQVLDRRFQSRPRRWMAWLMQKYFANPWLAAGLAAAAVIFVCTVVQAVYSVLSYRKGGN
uniref:Uncharacterized protein n=1 Tax=Oryza punctata TaxID=4537 RepID=A0A0E0LU48_ORYPU